MTKVTFTPPRPTLNDEFIKASILEFVENNFQEEWEDEDDQEEIEYLIESMSDDLFNAVNKCGLYFDDEIMNYLIKDKDWEFSSFNWGKVQELTSFINNRLKEAEKQWVEENNIQPPFPIGSQVKYQGEIFTIIGIYEYEPARYKLTSDEFIAKYGENSSKSEKFEDVELIED